MFPSFINIKNNPWIAAIISVIIAIVLTAIDSHTRKMNYTLRTYCKASLLALLVTLFIILLISGNKGSIDQLNSEMIYQDGLELPLPDLQ